MVHLYPETPEYLSRVTWYTHILGEFCIHCKFWEWSKTNWYHVCQDEIIFRKYVGDRLETSATMLTILFLLHVYDRFNRQGCHQHEVVTNNFKHFFTASIEAFYFFCAHGHYDLNLQNVNEFIRSISMLERLHFEALKFHNFVPAYKCSVLYSTL